MRYALMADVHGNLPALEAVLADLAAHARADAAYHLGDLVGYAPWPNEVASLLRAHDIPGIAGNYDSTVAADYPHCGCRYEDPVQEVQAHESYAWTRAHITPETRRYLGALPFRLDIRVPGGHVSGGRTVFLFHGTPTLNTLYWTEDRPDAFCTKMAGLVGAKGGDVLAFGHTHKPWHREVEGIHFVNAGSVGRPKDGDRRAGYVVLEAGETGPVRLEFRRVEYDVERAIAAIRASELPDAFAEYLLTGGKPVPAGRSAPQP